QHAKGTVVNLTVSNGKVELPDVTQQPFSTANATLAGLGLTVTPAPAYSCTGGTVTQQSAPAGDIAQGSTVVLTYCAASSQPTQPPASGGDTGGDDGGDGGDGQ
ncbi:MAG: PASTA domain-containing protein, partial [Patulibacter sp.]|nr:PASTA domain-containing protein [Patulibacter sp.]